MTDFRASVEFLRRVTRPGTWMTVVAINPVTGKTIGEGFQLDTVDAVAEFLYQHEDCNLYWSVNPLSARINKKPTKRDVSHMQWVQLDRDELTEAALHEIRSYRLPPTIIVRSGGGYQAFWMLREPVHVNGNASMLEAANKQVIADLHGDKSTWNLDRIMRLPGTMNWPTATNRKKGRVPVEAELVEFHDYRQYAIEDFVDRSRHLLSEVGKDIRAGVHPDEVLARHQSHPHAADQADPARAVSRAIAKVENDDDKMVAAVNAEHALIWIDGRPYVLWKHRWSNGLPELSTVEDMKRRWQKYKVRRQNPVDVWMDSPDREEYERFVFEPGITVRDQKFNLFRGWGAEPVKGDCSLFLQHIHEVVCDRDASLADYVIQWLANSVQSPREKPGPGLAMGSGQGTGKGAVARYLKPIYGDHFLQLAGSEQLLSRFNDFLASKLIVFADEAMFAGDRRGINKLKSYMTEDTITIERKHVPAISIPSYTRFIFATNDDHIAPAEADDRRFVILKLNESKRGATSYWAALEQERKNGGPSALLHHLLYEVAVTKNLRETPKTRELAEQKLLGLDHIGNFWRSMLMDQHHCRKEGYGDDATELHWQFGSVVGTKTLHDFYLDYAHRMRVAYPASLDALGRGLRRFVTLVKREGRRDECSDLGLKPRTVVYELPSLQDARLTFEAALGGQRLRWDAEPEGGL